LQSPAAGGLDYACGRLADVVVHDRIVAVLFDHGLDLGNVVFGQYCELALDRVQETKVFGAERDSTKAVDR
jgi:hypothetical protein